LQNTEQKFKKITFHYKLPAILIKYKIDTPIASGLFLFRNIIIQILNKLKIIVVKSSQKDKNLFNVRATILAFK